MMQKKKKKGGVKRCNVRSESNERATDFGTCWIEWSIPAAADPAVQGFTFFLFTWKAVFESTEDVIDG